MNSLAPTQNIANLDYTQNVLRNTNPGLAESISTLLTGLKSSFLFSRTIEMKGASLIYELQSEQAKIGVLVSYYRNYQARNFAHD